MEGGKERIKGGEKRLEYMLFNLLIGNDVNKEELKMIKQICEE
jgi:hypothetical protein